MPVESVCGKQSWDVFRRLIMNFLFQIQIYAYLIAENHMVIENFAGLPSMTLPLTYSKGLPVGINVSSNHFKEGDMFMIASAIEKITGLKECLKEEY